MRINGTGGATPQLAQAGNQQIDAVSKSIQKQIASKQKELQNLSSNQELDMEEKRKKRQEIMQEINVLNNQLRQHQIEQRREAANAERNPEKGSAMEEMIGGNRRNSKSGTRNSGLSQASMQSLISADSTLSQAQVQGSVVKGMENRANILKSEISQDAGRTDVTAKKEELAGLEQRMEQANAAQMNTLGEADKEMQKVREPEETAEKAVEEDKEKDKKNHTASEQKQPSIDIYL